jgi:bile acid:Na+ symporter, BASS family
MEFLTEQSAFINSQIIPWVLRLVMLGLGLSLTLADFKRVISFPKAAAIGLTAQLIGLPLTAFLLAWIFGPAPAVAVGLVILAICPSGVTSNAYTFASRGDVPLCVTLAALTSMITVFTIPFLTYFALQTFMGSDERPELPVLQMLQDLIFMTLFPVAMGMLIRYLKPEMAKKAEEPIRKVVLYLLYLVLGLGVLSSWNVIIDEIATVGPLVITMNLLTMGLGFGLGKMLGLPPPQVVTITYEVGVQNLALAFAITFNILQNPALAVTALIYAAVMPATALIFIRIARRLIESEGSEQIA